MKTRLNFLVLWGIVALLLVVPSSAAINTIPQGGTAFIGEQGLDIRATGVTTGSTIAWFGSQSVSTGAPTTTYIVDDATNYYIAPSSFGGKTGAWFTFPGRKLAFYVADPSLTLQIYDESSDFQVVGTTRWVPKDDSIGFRIVSNLYQMANRPGSSGAPVTIRIRSPDGAEYTQVSGNSLVDIPVSTSPYSTGPIWNTAGYSSGTYTVWAECNANSMKDNYDEQGKTTTYPGPGGNLLIQSINPLITSSITPTSTTPRATATGTEAVSTRVTVTEPATTVPTPLPTTEVPVSTTVPTPVSTETTQPPTPPVTPTKAPLPGVLVILAIAGGALAFCHRRHMR